MIENINVGLTANDGLGDKLRDAFIMVNENFDAIDAILTGTGTLTISQIAGLQTALDNINNQLFYIPLLQQDIQNINNTLYTINQTLNSQNSSIADLYNEITNLQDQIYTKVEEAPIDGVTYGRKDGHWVVVTGGGGTLDLDGVLGNGNTAVDKEIHINNNGASVTTTITPSYINLTNGSYTNNIQSNLIQLDDANSGLHVKLLPNALEFFTGPTQYLKGNPAQNTSFFPSFLLPAKNLTADWTLATTADYTLQNVTTLQNTTNQDIQLQPLTNTGTGSKYGLINNSQFYLYSQNEGYSRMTNDKIVWNRFGNTVSLGGWDAAGSNSANYILPTKSPATYTLATTADIHNIPAGGTGGQILAKISATDYSVGWIDNYTEQVKTTVKAAEVLTKGQAVYISGSNGTNILVSKGSNLTEMTSSKTLGLIAQDLAVNGQGFVITDGLLSGLNTSGATAGDAVWLGTASGSLLFGLANKPSAPNHMVYIGVVTRAHATQGEIFIRPQNGFELEELHNVKIVGVTSSQVLQYDGVDGLWKNQTFNPGLTFNQVQRAVFLRG